MEARSEKKNSSTAKSKLPPIQAPTADNAVSPDLLSPDCTGSVLEYPAVTAAAYTIKKGVKETPLEVSIHTHTCFTPLTHRPHSAPLSSQTCWE